MGRNRTAEEQRAYRKAHPHTMYSGPSGVRYAEEQREYRARSKAAAIDANRTSKPRKNEYMDFRNYVLAALAHYCVKIEKLPAAQVHKTLEGFNGAYSAYLTHTFSEKKHGEVSPFLDYSSLEAIAATLEEGFGNAVFHLLMMACLWQSSKRLLEFLQEYTSACCGKLQWQVMQTPIVLCSFFVFEIAGDPGCHAGF